MSYVAHRMLVLASMVVTAFSLSDTTRLRGGPSIDQKTPLPVTDRNRRRHLVEDTTCQIHLAENTFEPTEDHPNGYSEQNWACELPRNESDRIGSHFVEIVDADGVLNADTISGETSIMFSEIIIDTNSVESKLYIPGNSSVIVQNGAQQTSRRYENPSTTGNITALMVRIVDSENVQPDKSVQELRDDVFFDGSSLKAQYEACSYKKLEIEPFSGTTSTGHDIQEGVTEISVDYDVALGDENDVDLRSASLNAAYAQIGDLDSDAFDVVMFCLPPDPHSKRASSRFDATRYSFFSNDRCSSVGTLMKEVGHTLGLANSGTMLHNENDRSGVMGSIHFEDGFKRCFNPAKNHQLGWYPDQTLSIDPLTYATETFEAPVFILNGVSDYGKKPDALVVLELAQASRDRTFYVGYNRATDVNADTPVHKNKVTVLRTNHENGAPYGSSTMLASLHPGQSHTIPDFNGEPGRDVEVRFVRVWEEDATIEVVDVINDRHIDWDITPTAPCSDHSIEIKTDNYPSDVYWTITENRALGHILFRNSVYTDANSVTVQTVCIPDRDGDGLGYKFRIYDDYGDGMPGGYYKGYGPGGDLLFEGQDSFSVREHVFGASQIEIIENFSKKPKRRRSRCKNAKQKVRVSDGVRQKSSKKSCRWVAEKNKCDKMVDGKPLWKNCRKSCSKCKSKR